MPFDPTPQHQRTADLIAAKKLIEGGWCKNAEHAANQYGHYYCALGAINAAVDKSGRRAAIHFVACCLPGGRGHIPSFNDDPETSKQDILDLFDRAIEKSINSS